MLITFLSSIKGNNSENLYKAIDAFGGANDSSTQYIYMCL